MKSILVISKEEHAYRLILSAFKSNDTVKKAEEKASALDLLKKKRFDMIFIDLKALNNIDAGENYQEALMPFWQLQPSTEIIVMTPQEKIRNAVKAVKAGATDYLTYPLDAEELKLVSEHINKTRILESELDYLRGQFGRSELFELLRTNS
ncbi:MAG: response regulator, partial [Desulfobacterales bacterium]